MSENVKCRHCGQCCHYPNLFDSSKPWLSCQHLITTGSRTTCRQYKNRLGLFLDLEKHFVCVLRSEIDHDLPGCPYNSGRPLAIITLSHAKQLKPIRQAIDRLKRDIDPKRVGNIKCGYWER